MTTVNLALAFARQGAKVGLLDVDLNGPCVPRMMGLHGQSLTMTADGRCPGGSARYQGRFDGLLSATPPPVRWKGPMDLESSLAGIDGNERNP